MIRGEAVEVRRFDESSGWSSEAVGNVLPGAPSTEGGTSGAAVTSVEFHFPKPYGAPLKGKWVRWRGRDYQVLGDPQPYLDGATPGPWNRPAKAAARTYAEPIRVLARRSGQDDYGRPTASWEPAWEGLCRERDRLTEAGWQAGASSDDGALSVALMPDAALLSLRASSCRATVLGREMEVSSIGWAGGPGSEVAMELVERRET